MAIYKNPKMGSSNIFHKTHTDYIEYKSNVTLTQTLNEMNSYLTNHATRLKTIEAKNTAQDQTLSDHESRLNNLINLIYPVNSVKITFDNKNPGTYLTGTTWQLISTGRYIRGAASTDQAAYTGGTYSSVLRHSHRVKDHFHTINHQHSIPGHTHTVNNHVHSTANHTLTLSQIPAHNHGKASLIGRAWNLAIQDRTDINATGIINKYKIDQGTQGAGGNYYNDSSDGIEIDASHTHTTQGGGGAHNHGNTGGAAPNTNSVALTTNSGGGNSGLVTGLTTDDADITVTLDPQYMALYIWRRIK